MRRTGLVIPTIAISVLLCVIGSVAAEEAVEEPPKLLGRCSVEQLREDPFGEWFSAEYTEYVTAPAVLESLRAANGTGLSLQLFFGSWCGDSRREVPRMMRLFDDAGFAAEQVELIAVDTGDGVHKQAPGHEERGLEIYRVPTLVVLRDGSEIGRLVEFPVLSLERDLLAIVSDDDYEPNYRSYPILREWLRAGLLSDTNVSAHGLAQQLRERLAHQGELAAAARVMLERGDVAEGLKLMEANAALYRESSRAHAAVAEARLRNGDAEGAQIAAQRALALNDDPEAVADLVEILHRSRSGEPQKVLETRNASQ